MICKLFIQKNAGEESHYYDLYSVQEYFPQDNIFLVVLKHAMSLLGMSFVSPLTMTMFPSLVY